MRLNRPLLSLEGINSIIEIHSKMLQIDSLIHNKEAPYWKMMMMQVQSTVHPTDFPVNQMMKEVAVLHEVRLVEVYQKVD